MEDLIRTVLSKLESNTTAIKSSQRQKLIATILKDFYLSHPEEHTPQEVLWELQLWEIRVQHPDLSSRKSTTRFPGMQEGNIGDMYPNLVELMSNETLIFYLRKRVAETNNPLQKSRYSDLLWEMLKSRGNRDAFQFGNLAASAYLDIVQLCLQAEEYIELVDALKRATELTIHLNNRVVAIQVIAELTKTLDQIPAPAKYRWILELGNALLKYRNSKFQDLIPLNFLETFRETCLEAIAFHDSVPQRNHYILHDLMALCSDLSQQLGEEVEAKRWQVAIAESLVKEAKERETLEGPSGGSLVALKFAEQAFHLYQQLASQTPVGSEQDQLLATAETLKPELRRLIQQAPTEMKTESISIDLPPEFFNSLLAPFREIEPEYALGLMATCPFLLPDLDHLQDLAHKSVQENVFLSLFNTITLTQGRKVDETTGLNNEETHLQYQTNGWFWFQVQLLDYLFQNLTEIGKFTLESFLNHIRQWPLVQEKDIPFIEAGVEKYFNQDYISAIHILTPRIESVLKGIFEQANLPPVVVPNTRQVREQTFGDFIRREEVRKTLGPPIWKYIYYTLLDEKGFNLRNDIAHGWLSADSCNRANTQILLFILILLTQFRLTDDPDATNEDVQNQPAGEIQQPPTID